MGKENYGDLIIFEENKTLSAIGSTTVTGPWISPGKVGALRFANTMVFVLDVTAIGTDVGDTFDFKIQEGLPGSSVIPTDRVHFTQLLGNGGAKQFIARIQTFVAVAATPAPNVALAASLVVDGPICDLLRYVIAVVDADADTTITFSLKGYLKG